MENNQDQPDPKQYFVEPEFTEALNKAGSLVTHRAKSILYSSVYLHEESISATSGDVIMQVWHGCTTPVDVIVPVSFIRKLQGKTINSLGSTPDSLTAWFDDGSWLKTKVHHDEDFPNLPAFLGLKADFQPTPPHLWEALEKRKRKREDRLRFEGVSFSIEALQSIRPFAEEMAFDVTHAMTYFRGHHVRGAIAQRPLEGDAFLRKLSDTTV